VHTFWRPTALNISRAAVPGSVVHRQRVWLRPRESGILTAVETAGGLQLAATCVLGDAGDDGQDVELSFWLSGILARVTQRGTEVALVEGPRVVGDRVVASGNIL